MFRLVEALLFAYAVGFAIFTGSQLAGWTHSTFADVAARIEAATAQH